MGPLLLLLLRAVLQGRLMAYTLFSHELSQVMKFTDGQGVDVIIDFVGGSYFSSNIACES